MKKIGSVLMGIGAIGFLIGGAGLDGPTGVQCAILSVVSLGVTAVGNRLYKLAERRRKIEAAEKINKRPKEATFRVWVESCGMDVRF